MFAYLGPNSARDTTTVKASEGFRHRRRRGIGPGGATTGLRPGRMSASAPSGVVLQESQEGLS